jgi:SAM-dependent methyltransferase
VPQGIYHTGVVVDSLFSEPSLAELYDAFCEGRRDFGFYLPLVMSAESVLDVGCGTGELLRLARQAGHTGRLCGLDPAEAMLRGARAADINGSVTLPRSIGIEEFDLVVMTSHAFQVFVEDDQLRASLARSVGPHRARPLRLPKPQSAGRAWEGWIEQRGGGRAGRNRGADGARWNTG